MFLQSIFASKQHQSMMKLFTIWCENWRKIFRGDNAAAAAESCKAGSRCCCKQMQNIWSCTASDPVRQKSVEKLNKLSPSCQNELVKDWRGKIQLPKPHHVISQEFNPSRIYFFSLVILGCCYRLILLWILQKHSVHVTQVLCKYWSTYLPLFITSCKH